MKGRIVTKECKEKLKNINLGKKLSKKTKLKISKNNAKYWLGKKRGKDTIKKLKKARKFQNMDHLKRKIKQIDKNTGEVIKIWNSITEAAKFFNVERWALRSVLKKRSNFSCGFKWEYV